MFASKNHAHWAMLVACFAIVACGDDGSGAGGSGAAGGSGGSGGDPMGGSPTTGGGGEGTGGAPVIEGGGGVTNSGGSGGMEEGGAADGGAGGGEPQMVFSCSPSEGDHVGDACGIFVNPDVTPGVGLGTKLSPVASISEAVELLGDTRRIYVCSFALSDEVVLPSSVALHGGLDCNEAWQWRLDARTPWTSEPDTVPLKILGAPNVTNVVTGFTITAADAVTDSGSSIATIVDQAVVSFERMDFIAGNGADGTDGAAGTPGLAGSNGIAATDTVEGAGGVSPCGSTGGNGGFVSQLDPQNVFGDGQEGLPDQNNGGEHGSVAPPPLGNCDNGGAGLDRGNTTAFGGFPGIGLGNISVDGFVGVASTDGANGLNGGGGGGGGAKPHQPGGGGGGGGCGGGKGHAGLYGGSSIAMISLTSTITITDSTFSVGLGGAGGAQGLGGVGGIGGLGGAGDLLGCDGGVGGRGQRGGPGSAGPGGQQFGIAYRGNLPTLVDSTLPTLGSPAEGSPMGVAEQTHQYN